MGPRVVGSAWAHFQDVFSTGLGTIYAVRPDGQLLQYQHDGFATGEETWSGIDELPWRQFQMVGTG